MCIVIVCMRCNIGVRVLLTGRLAKVQSQLCKQQHNCVNFARLACKLPTLLATCGLHSWTLLLHTWQHWFSLVVVDNLALPCALLMCTGASLPTVHWPPCNCATLLVIIICLQTLAYAIGACKFGLHNNQLTVATVQTWC